jgi:hypothetical protein
MKKLILTIVLLVLMISGKSQTTFWINNITATVGQNIVIPVYVKGFDSISTVNLRLFCMPPLPYTMNLVYMGIQNVHPNLSAPVFNYTSNMITYELFMAAFSLNCMSIPDSSIAFEMKFNYLGGIGTLIWDTANCGLGSCGVNPIIPAFINGYINTSAGINEIGHLIIRCFPNPTSDIVNFTAVVKDFRLYSTYGQLLFSDKNIQKVDLSSFGKGVYIAEMDNRMTKIIKQ